MRSFTKLRKVCWRRSFCWSRNSALPRNDTLSAFSNLYKTCSRHREQKAFLVSKCWSTSCPVSIRWGGSRVRRLTRPIRQWRALCWQRCQGWIRLSIRSLNKFFALIRVLMWKNFAIANPQYILYSPRRIIRSISLCHLSCSRFTEKCLRSRTKKADSLISA